MHSVAPTEDNEIPGLIFVDDFVNEEDERMLLAAVDAAEWRADLTRRVQHYGWAYDYKARSVDARLFLGPLPEWALLLSERLVRSRLLDREADQVIVNEYLPGQGIAKHIDCIPCFEGRIVTISLGDTWEMFFWPPAAVGVGVGVGVGVKGGAEKEIRALKQRSAVSLGGAARMTWRHEIPKRKSEPRPAAAAGTRPRLRRVSLTFRKVRSAREEVDG